MERKQPAALFDFDFTLTSSESFMLFLQHVLKLHPRALVEIPRLAAFFSLYPTSLVSKERMKTEALRLFHRVPPADRAGLIRSFCADVLPATYLREGLERVRWHRDQGHTLVLASASLDTYLRRVQEDLGFDLLVCTRTSPGGRPAVVGTNCWGPEKVHRMRRMAFFDRTDWDASWAYSDSPSDMPMFLLCGHPVATQPSRSLRRHAQREGWEIVDWV